MDTPPSPAFHRHPWGRCRWGQTDGEAEPLRPGWRIEGQARTRAKVPQSSDRVQDPDEAAGGSLAQPGRQKTPWKKLQQRPDPEEGEAHPQKQVLQGDACGHRLGLQVG